MIRTYNKIIMQEPHEQKHYYNKAVLLMEMGEYKLALDTFYEAVAINTQDPDAWYNIGICFTALKSYEDAKEAYEAVLVLEENADIYLQLGKTHHLLGELDKATNALTKALTFSSTVLQNQILFALANVLTDQEKYNEAVTVLQQITCAESDDLWKDVQYNLANTYLDLQQYKNAIEIYEPLVKRFPDFNYIFNLAFAYESVSPDKAISLYEQLLDKKHYAVYYNLACIYARMGEEQVAIEYIQKMYEIVYDKEGMKIRIETDPDFQKLLENQDFQKILRS